MQRILPLLLLGLTFLFANQLEAQGPPRGGRSGRPQLPQGQGGIFGRILEANNQKPIEFANIGLYKDSTLVNGAVTDSTGIFKIIGVPYGTYRIEVRFMGFITKRIDNIQITQESRLARVGKISLEPNIEIGDDVVVEVERSPVEYNIDKKIVNVSNDLTSIGGTAIDALRNVPGVSVDMDDNVSLRGTSNITVLIDGRASGLTGLSRTAVLEQIPASNIERIEIMTNPSAKYDPDGMGGIINIILKKKKERGFNGQASASVGTRDKYNGSLSLNYLYDKWNFYGTYNARDDQRWGRSDNFRITDLGDSTYYLAQDRNNTRRRISHNARLGVDYNLTDNDVISLYGNLGWNERSHDENQDILYTDDENKVNESALRTSTEKDISNSWDANLTYDRKFSDERQRLSTAFSFSKNNGHEDVLSEQYGMRYYSGLGAYEDYQPSNETGNSYFINAQADYSHPIAKQMKLEVGWKSTVRNIDNDFELFDRNSSGELVLNAFQTNQFIYNEQIHAAYGQIGGNIKNFQYQVGLRAEQAFTDSRLETTNEDFSNDYTSFFPSFTLRQNFDEKGTVKLSYSRRINRPSTRSLNPFTDFSDPLNLRRGNPFLRPEYIHSTELEFDRRVNLGSHFLYFTTGLFYRYTEDVIQRLTSIDDNGIRTIEFSNQSSQESIGIDLFALWSIGQSTRINASASFFHNTLHGSGQLNDLNRKTFGWNSRVSVNLATDKLRGWALWKTLALNFQISGFYRGGFRSLQSDIEPIFSSEFAVSRKILNRRGQIALRFSDPFNTRQFEYTTYGEGFSVNGLFKRESRILYLAFTYNFGKEIKGKSTRKRGGRPDSSSGGDDMM